MISIKALAPIFALILAFSAGYYVSGLQQNKTALEQEKAERQAVDEKIEVSQKNANTLEEELKQVKQHEQNIISNAAAQTKKVDRGGSNCCCIDHDFIKLYNQQSAEYERILSGQHAAKLPKIITKP